MSSRRLYLSPTAHSSPGMKRSKMNNKPISRSQSVSITSESTLSLSDLEDSMAGMASITRRTTDGMQTLVIVPPLFLHENSMSPSHFHRLSEEILPPPWLVIIAQQLIAPVNHHPQHLTIRPLHPLIIPPPIYAPPSSDKSTRPGLQEAMPATLGGLRATPSRKQKFYVVTNGRTMGVFTQWYAQFLEDGIDIDDAFSPTLEAALQRWNECWMMDRIGHDDELGRMGRGGVKGTGPEVVPTFYYIIVKGKVPHVTSFLDDAIANAGNHPYREVFVVRDELTALKFLSDKLRDDEVLRADF
ncbi:hypothetical protein ARMGADRAFT_1035546 [Armillaria gallica]|uniref:Uncharacterized protein n=1 Tax=Armillaria gallica TaxID=47427 RepID=A0A2H3DFX3_ARMGA|nr:hypothetical protein ARMGADRAFT_1035546 [Armillaria gallica]